MPILGFGRGAQEYMWYVYALYSKELDRFYIGYTENMERRLAEHQAGKTHTTDRMGIVELVYYEACFVKEDATRRERQLKTGFGRGYLRKRLEKYLYGTISSVG